MRLVVTQDYVRFDTISIGSPFYFSDRIWIRTNGHAGTEFGTTAVHGDGVHRSCCSFRVYPQDEEFHEFYVDQESGWFIVQTVEVRP